MPSVLRGFHHALVDFFLRKFAQLQRESHVLVAGHVRIERVVLEDHFAMSRSFGGVSFTMRPPMAIVPPLISSSPAIMRSVVDFPQPRRPDQHDKFLVADLEIHFIDGLDAAGVNFFNVLENDFPPRLAPLHARKKRAKCAFF